MASFRLGWSSYPPTTREDVVSIEDFAFPVDASNVEQAGEWDGDDGDYWATHHREYERLLGVFDDTLIQAGEVGSRDRCLDVGCGTGATTRALAAQAVEGSVVGLDLSGPMLAIARSAADQAGIGNVEFIQADVQVHSFEAASFDVVVSRMGCMFFGDPATAFANLGRAIRPGGRLAMTVWQEASANQWITAIDTALGETMSLEGAVPPAAYAPGPFSLSDPALITSLLRGADFADVTVQGLHIPLAFGAVEDAQAFLETWINDDLDADARARAKASLNDLLVENATAEGVRLRSATWLITGQRPT